LEGVAASGARTNLKVRGGTHPVRSCFSTQGALPCSAICKSGGTCPPCPMESVPVVAALTTTSPLSESTTGYWYTNLPVQKSPNANFRTWQIPLNTYRQQLQVNWKKKTRRIHCSTIQCIKKQHQITAMLLYL